MSHKTAASGFPGFSGKTLTFLKDLGANNNRAWFEANRADYEAGFLEPAKAFVGAIAEPLTQLAPAVRAEPRVNGSIFRINRDIRFSKDKTPYKDHLDLWFWEGERKGAVSGFFFRLTATHLITGAGAHGFDRERLASFREAIGNATEAERLGAIIETIERGGRSFGAEIGGSRYKKLPRGIVPANEAAERLLLHDALWASCEEPHPTNLGSPAIVDHCLVRWRLFAPLHQWLVTTLG